ncbi:unnamed protein product [Microthlaspi erraticum]|uniref:Uncharacterized protein n=1 Tax=Microthlaspi erraticum TaxID=1685480 RepID=A0A6D2ISI1_9BRAS|nr:unnamed protein product [Microthlaspi erraticum]
MTRSRTRSLREKFNLSVENILGSSEQDLTEIRHQAGWRAGEVDVVRVAKKLVMIVKNTRREEKAIHNYQEEIK